MAKTRDNHYVARWYQKGFSDAGNDELCYLTRRDVESNGEVKVIYSKRWHTPAQKFYKKDLYSIIFGSEINDDIEQKFFGPIDDNGSRAVRAFLTNDQSLWHHNFQDLFTYIDAQKLRTPKGLDWIKSKYPELNQVQLMMEMQALRAMHCVLWAEGVRELVSAEDSDVKFIISDHPVTVYNFACPPGAALCKYPSDPDIALKGSQTIFPLDKNRCLILTNLEYAKNPEGVNPLEQRTHAIRVRQSMVNTIEFINSRKLTADEVIQINYVIKSRAQSSVAAGKEEWLYPEAGLTCDWAGIQKTMLPPTGELHRFGGEMFAKFADGSVHYQDAFGRTEPQSDFLQKKIDESKVSRNDLCGCGSGRKYKKCCLSIPAELRVTWGEISIRERNLAFCNCIRDVLGLDSGKTWIDVRRELSDHQISEIYRFYSALWPRDTNIYSLLPKSDGKFRGLYTGILDVRVIGAHALPMASYFDELLIESPVLNPNIVKPEFSPIQSPGKYKYQALKDILFMLEMEPFIGAGLVNLIPDPAGFDLDLMRAMMDMAEDRTRDKAEVGFCKQDLQLHYRLATEDLLNTIAMMPRAMQIQALIHQFGLSEADSEKTISELELHAEASPLMLLQQMEAGKGGQFLQFKMGPNYEMSLFIAQVTGSVVVTDSGSRWQELIAAQHQVEGVISYPWSGVLDGLNKIPIDYNFVKTLQRSQGCIAAVRQVLKSVDGMILVGDQDSTKLSYLAGQVSDVVGQFRNDSEAITMSAVKVLSPGGGLCDARVQRLLAMSACPRYDRAVRAIYGISLTT